MTEEDAREWVRARWGSEQVRRLERYGALLTREAERQNLVSVASLSTLWARHLTDSAQLVPLAEDRGGTWVDVGSGAGLPGLVVALLRPEPIVLVEPRTRRAEFLAYAIDDLGLSAASVVRRRVEKVAATAAVLSARAVAAPAQLFGMTKNVADAHTLFLLPSGRSAEESLSFAQQEWKGVFHVKQSITDPAAKIIVAYGVRSA